MRTDRLAATLVVLSLFGCANAPDPGPPIETGRLGALELDRELRGGSFETSAKGPWAFRRIAAADAPADASAEKRRRIALSGIGGGEGGGGATPELALLDDVTSGSEDGDYRARTEHVFDRGSGVDKGDGPVEDPVIKDAKVADHGERPARSPAAPPAPAGEVADSLDGEYEFPETTAHLGMKTKSGGAANAPARRLKAGATDDNADYAAYLEFLAAWGEKDAVQAGYQPLDVRDRRHVRVVDAAGNPVPGAVVAIADVERDRLVATGTTYGDGRVPFYPHLREAAGDEIPVPVSGYVVEARLGEMRARTRWDLSDDGDLVLAFDDEIPLLDPLRLDVLFLIDTTGSMSDEIASIKASLLQVTQQLRSLGREFDLRYGAVLFRDLTDAYVTATHAFTPDIEAFDKALQSVQATGGGDTPESVNQGLAHAVDGVAWRDDAAKVCFLIGDAPPHMDYPGDVWYGESVQAAVAKGIRIHSVAASGLDARGTLVWRQVAQFTRGKFIFIEYGTPAESAASHGVEGAVKSNNLEDILFEQIRDELARWGR